MRGLFLALAQNKSLRAMAMGFGPARAVSRRFVAGETLDEAIAVVQRLNISPDCFEFQMLYGIRPGLQLQLAEEGYRVRTYVPYGDQWYPYFMRRMAERPANLLFLVRTLIRA